MPMAAIKSFSLILIIHLEMTGSVPFKVSASPHSEWRSKNHAVRVSWEEKTSSSRACGVTENQDNYVVQRNCREITVKLLFIMFCRGWMFLLYYVRKDYITDP